MTHNFWIYLLIMSGVTYAIRVLPLTLLRRPVKSRFLRSFLYYTPYATLAVMTFPAILSATGSPIAGAAALVGGLLAAWFDAGLFKTAALCCALVLILEYIPGIG